MRISLEQAISEALEALEVVSSLQIKLRGSMSMLFCFTSLFRFALTNDFSHF